MLFATMFGTFDDCLLFFLHIHEFLFVLNPTCHYWPGHRPSLSSSSSSSIFLLTTNHHQVPTSHYTIPLSQARVVQSGRDITVVGYGAQMHVLAHACNEVKARDGIECELIDLRTIAPFDRRTIVDSVRSDLNWWILMAVMLIVILVIFVIIILWIGNRNRNRNRNIEIRAISKRQIVRVKTLLNRIAIFSDANFPSILLIKKTHKQTKHTTNQKKKSN